MTTTPTDPRIAVFRRLSTIQIGGVLPLPPTISATTTSTTTTATAIRLSSIRATVPTSGLSRSWTGSTVVTISPFWSISPPIAPHGPLWVPDHYRDPYRDQVKANEASFFGMIANIDQNLGRLNQYLHQNGLHENTILIFMTDNGTASGENVFNADMRGKKSSLYEGGHRVPFFVRWPDGDIQGGRDVEGLTRGTDLLPTLIDLCGLDLPDGLTFDGLSLADSLQTGQPVSTKRISVVQFGHPNIRYLGLYGWRSSRCQVAALAIVQRPRTLRC